MTEITHTRVRIVPDIIQCLVGVTLFIMLSVMSFNAYALEFECQAPGDTRYLRVDIPGEERLCEVSVKYQLTGERRVMWYAENDTLFCSAKAYELREKYENLWNFKCSNWPDTDGIDKLSPSHRAILDVQLKSLITQGRQSAEPFEVSAVKATASTPLDQQPGTLALQFFLTTGDVTQIIVSDGLSWEVFATIDNLAEKITGDANVTTALIENISDSGALEISTTVADGATNACYGNQVLMVQPDSNVSVRTVHRYICDSANARDNDPG